MQNPPITKYRPFPGIELPNRQWPSRTIDAAPLWCSVDLRDGNQALAVPMNLDEKLELFQALVDIGVKEIEVGFPAASQTEYAFTRKLIEENLIPDDVSIQVLTQSRAELITRTFEAVEGAKQAIVHLYNSTSPIQRRVVFGLDKQGIIDIAVKGTELCRKLAAGMAGTGIQFQYSPESFSDTEPEFALEICQAVMEVWEPSADKPMILNLPATVEMATPNVHADQIEWFCRHLPNRDAAIISLHTHNDRGTGVAATELGLLAGADRVEGTLFGNGERTGNVDLVTVALNLYTQGIHPGLDFSDLNKIREIYERCTRMDVPPRHPYAGELVFTAFSGSHQDAINKGLARQRESESPLWQVPYLPIDPQDLGRNYRAIIRINSQSGKGGVAYIMEKEYGFQLPKLMHKEFGKVINDVADRKGLELTPNDVYEVFREEYLERTSPLDLVSFQATTKGRDQHDVTCRAKIKKGNETVQITGAGNGPIAAFVHALNDSGMHSFELLSYSEHSIGSGADTNAASYIQIQTKGQRTFFGAGMDSNIEMASIKAVMSAVNRSLADRCPPCDL